MKHSIALIGLSGTGKSTIARLLARRLGWRRCDIDAMVVAYAGCPIAELFAVSGEAYFRDLETAMLREALVGADDQPCVIATGGGIVLCEANRTLLRDHAYIVWLDAPTTTLVKRLAAHAEQRPLLASADPAARIESLRAERGHLYQALANQIIDTDDMNPEQIVAVCSQALRR